MKTTLWIICLLAAGSIHAQSITILNERSGIPIPEVVIYDSLGEIVVLTDIRGRANLSSFKPDQEIFFRHPSFEIRSALKSALPATIYLTELVIHTEQVVISANKWEQELSDIPQNIVAIEADDIQFRNSPTSADVLAQSGEVFVQKSQLGGGSPSLRGFAANSVLLVFDGVRMNNAIYRSGNLQNVISIDPLVLDGVEVLMGSGSVIYGSDALGGVMDFHSIDPNFSSNDKVILQPDFIIRYGSAANEKTIHGSLIAEGEKLSSFTSVSFNDYGDLQTGTIRNEEYPDYGIYSFLVGQDQNGNDILLDDDPSIQSPTGYHAFSILQKIRYRPSDRLDLQYSFYHNQSGNIPRFDRLIETDETNTPINAEWYYGPQKWTMHSLRISFLQPTNWFDRLRILPSYQKYEESRFDRKFSSSLLRSQNESLDIAGISFDAEKSLGGRTELYYGIESITNWVQSKASRKNLTDESIVPVTPRYPEGGSTFTNSAAYVSLTHSHNDQLIYSGGIRYTRVWLNAVAQNDDNNALETRDVSLSNGSLSGNAGLTWKLSPTSQISTLLSTGFRAPNVDDIGKVFELDGNDLIIPNRDLSPENTYNAEVSWRFEKNGALLETTVFYTHLTDAIIRGRGSINGIDSLLYDDNYYKLYTQVNASKARIYGISFRGSYRFSSQFGLTSTVNYTTGEDLESQEPLRHTTPLFGSLRANWLINRFHLEAFIDFNGNRYRKDIPSSEIDSKPYLYAVHRSDPELDGSPGWYTIGFRGSWQITPAFLFQLGVENILDHHYRPYSSGISAPGRNITLSLRITPR